MDHPPSRILIAEDDPEIAHLLRKYLEREGYAVDTAADGPAAVDRFQAAEYHLLLLDIMLPGCDGLEVCRRIRAKSNVPIVMLTARADEVDKLLGLGIGADDYITKPFSIHEVVMRVKAHLRRFLELDRHPPMEEERIVRGGLVIDRRRFRVAIAGRDIALTSGEFSLLVLLAAHPGRVFSKKQIYEAVRGEHYADDENTVTVQVRRLRKKIEPDPDHPTFIETVRGVGYRFRDGD